MTSDGWRFYKDELPPIGQKVIYTMFEKAGSHFRDDAGFWREPDVGMWNGSYNCGKSLVMEEDDCGISWSPATHWMPLPQLPKSEQ